MGKEEREGGQSGRDGGAEAQEEGPWWKKSFFFLWLFLSGWMGHQVLSPDRTSFEVKVTQVIT